MPDLSRMPFCCATTSTAATSTTTTTILPSTWYRLVGEYPSIGSFGGELDTELQRLDSRVTR